MPGVNLPKVPEGLRDMMKNLTKEVLREKPPNIYEFSAQYFETILQDGRDSPVRGHEPIESYETILNNRVRHQVPLSLVYSLIPDSLTELIKEFIKSVLRENPCNIYAFAVEYFRKLQMAKDMQTKTKTEYSAYENYFQKKDRYTYTPFVKCSCGRTLGNSSNDSMFFNQHSNKGKSKFTKKRIDAGRQDSKEEGRVDEISHKCETSSEEKEKPKTEKKDYSGMQYMSAIYVIQRQFRKYLTNKRKEKTAKAKVEAQVADAGVGMSMETAAFIIQKTFRKFVRNRLSRLRSANGAQLTKVESCNQGGGGVDDNVSEAASYTSASTALLSTESAGEHFEYGNNNYEEGVLQQTIKEDEEVENDNQNEQKLNNFNENFGIDANDNLKINEKSIFSHEKDAVKSKLIQENTKIMSQELDKLKENDAKHSNIINQMKNTDNISISNGTEAKIFDINEEPLITATKVLNKKTEPYMANYTTNNNDSNISEECAKDSEIKRSSSQDKTSLDEGLILEAVDNKSEDQTNSDKNITKEYETPKHLEKQNAEEQFDNLQEEEDDIIPKEEKSFTKDETISGESFEDLSKHENINENNKKIIAEIESENVKFEEVEENEAETSNIAKTDVENALTNQNSANVETENIEDKSNIQSLSAKPEYNVDQQSHDANNEVLEELISNSNTNLNKADTENDSNDQTELLNEEKNIIRYIDETSGEQPMLETKQSDDKVDVIENTEQQTDVNILENIDNKNVESKTNEEQNVKVSNKTYSTELSSLQEILRNTKNGSEEEQQTKELDTQKGNQVEPNGSENLTNVSAEVDDNIELEKTDAANKSVETQSGIDNHELDKDNIPKSVNDEMLSETKKETNSSNILANDEDSNLATDLSVHEAQEEENSNNDFPSHEMVMDQIKSNQGSEEVDENVSLNDLLKTIEIKSVVEGENDYLLLPEDDRKDDSKGSDTEIKDNLINTEVTENNIENEKTNIQDNFIHESQKELNIDMENKNQSNEDLDHVEAIKSEKLEGPAKLLSLESNSEEVQENLTKKISVESEKSEETSETNNNQNKSLDANVTENQSETPEVNENQENLNKITADVSDATENILEESTTKKVSLDSSTTEGVPELQKDLEHNNKTISIENNSSKSISELNDNQETVSEVLGAAENIPQKNSSKRIAEHKENQENNTENLSPEPEAHKNISEFNENEESSNTILPDILHKTENISQTTEGAIKNIAVESEIIGEIATLNPKQDNLESETVKNISELNEDHEKLTMQTDTSELNDDQEVSAVLDNSENNSQKVENQENHGETLTVTSDTIEDINKQKSDDEIPLVDSEINDNNKNASENMTAESSLNSENDAEQNCAKVVEDILELSTKTINEIIDQERIPNDNSNQNDTSTTGTFSESNVLNPDSSKSSINEETNADSSTLQINNPEQNIVEASLLGDNEELEANEETSKNGIECAINKELEENSNTDEALPQNNEHQEKAYEFKNDTVNTKNTNNKSLDDGLVDAEGKHESITGEIIEKIEMETTTNDSENLNSQLDKTVESLEDSKSLNETKDSTKTKSNEEDKPTVESPKENIEKVEIENVKIIEETQKSELSGEQATDQIDETALKYEEKSMENVDVQMVSDIKEKKSDDDKTNQDNTTTRILDIKPIGTQNLLENSTLQLSNNNSKNHAKKEHNSKDKNKKLTQSLSSGRLNIGPIAELQLKSFRTPENAEPWYEVHVEPQEILNNKNQNTTLEANGNKEFVADEKKLSEELMEKQKIDLNEIRKIIDLALQNQNVTSSLQESDTKTEFHEVTENLNDNQIDDDLVNVSTNENINNLTYKSERAPTYLYGVPNQSNENEKPKSSISFFVPLEKADSKKIRIKRDLDHKEENNRIESKEAMSDKDTGLEIQSNGIESKTDFVENYEEFFESPNISMDITYAADEINSMKSLLQTIPEQNESELHTPQIQGNVPDQTVSLEQMNKLAENIENILTERANNTNSAETLDAAKTPLNSNIMNSNENKLTNNAKADKNLLEQTFLVDKKPYMNENSNQFNIEAATSEVKTNKHGEINFKLLAADQKNNYADCEMENGANEHELLSSSNEIDNTVSYNEPEEVDESNESTENFKASDDLDKVEKFLNTKNKDLFGDLNANEFENGTEAANSPNSQELITNVLYNDANNNNVELSKNDNNESGTVDAQIMSINNTTDSVSLNEEKDFVEDKITENREYTKKSPNSLEEKDFNDENNSENQESTKNFSNLNEETDFVDEKNTENQVNAKNFLNLSEENDSVEEKNTENQENVKNCPNLLEENDFVEEKNTENNENTKNSPKLHEEIDFVDEKNTENQVNAKNSPNLSKENDFVEEKNTENQVNAKNSPNLSKENDFVEEKNTENQENVKNSPNLLEENDFVEEKNTENKEITKNSPNLNEEIDFIEERNTENQENIKNCPNLKEEQDFVEQENNENQEKIIEAKLIELIRSAPSPPSNNLSIDSDSENISTNFDARNKAAHVIQRLFKNYLNQKHDFKVLKDTNDYKNIAKNEAARVIQKAFRRFNEYVSQRKQKKYNIQSEDNVEVKKSIETKEECMELNLENRKVLNLAAAKIQRAYRKYRMQNSELELYKSFKDSKITLDEAQESAAIRIQKAFREYIQKKRNSVNHIPTPMLKDISQVDVAHSQAEILAAVIIQKAFRSYLRGKSSDENFDISSIDNSFDSSQITEIYKPKLSEHRSSLDTIVNTNSFENLTTYEASAPPASEDMDSNEFVAEKKKSEWFVGNEPIVTSKTSQNMNDTQKRGTLNLDETSTSSSNQIDDDSTITQLVNACAKVNDNEISTLSIGNILSNFNVENEQKLGDLLETNKNDEINLAGSEIEVTAAETQKEVGKTLEEDVDEDKYEEKLEDDSNNRDTQAVIEFGEEFFALSGVTNMNDLMIDFITNERQFSMQQQSKSVSDSIEIPYEIMEEPCIKKSVSTTNLTDMESSNDATKLEAEQMTTQNEDISANAQDESVLSESTTQSELGNDNSDFDTSLAETLESASQKMAMADEVIDKMSQRRASEVQTTPQLPERLIKEPSFEEPVIRPMSALHEQSSIELDDGYVVVLNELQREDTRESSAQSDSVVFGKNEFDVVEPFVLKDVDLSKTPMKRMYTIAGDDPKSIFKSVTIDETIKYIDPPTDNLSAGSSGSFCLDEDISENIRKKMMAYSLSEADSDFFEACHDGKDTSMDRSAVSNDDFNISTALADTTGTSTETESTIVSAATKIQAGARGFLTRRRMRRTSGGTKSSTQETKASFGNEAIGESLERQIEDEAAKKIQSAYRKHYYQNRKNNNGGDGEEGISQENSLAARRLTLQRGDAMRNDSTPDEDNSGNDNENTSSEKNQNSVLSQSSSGVMHKKPRGTYTVKSLTTRQNSLPVQIDSELFRVIPKHMRKRIRSADSEKKSRLSFSKN